MKRFTEAPALFERRSKIWGRMEQIVDAAHTAGATELTKAQAADYEKLEKELRSISQEIEDDHIERISADEGNTLARHSSYEKRLNHIDRTGNPGAQRVAPRGPSGLGRGLSGEEEESVALRSDQSVREHLLRTGSVPSEHEELSLGRYLRGALMGDWRGADLEYRAMGEATPSAGGILVPEILSATVIDKARAQAVTLKAGARTIPLRSDKTKIARVTGDPTAVWLTENTAATESDMVLEGIQLATQALEIGPVRCSIQLLDDAEELEETLQNAFVQQIALGLDMAILAGSGVPPVPRGIRNTTNVTLQSMGTNGAAPTNFDPFVTAIETVRTNNRDPNAVVYHPRTAGTLGKLKDTTNQPLRQPDDVAELGKFTTTQLSKTLTHGTSTDTSEAYVGYWPDAILAVRTQLRIKVLDQRYAEYLQVAFIGFGRYDIFLAHPESFVVIQGIRP